MNHEQTLAERVGLLSPSQKQSLLEVIEDCSPEKSGTEHRHELTAWVVVDGPVPETADLRKKAAERLPAAMVPRRFLFVKSLPKTSSGKLDRNRLPSFAKSADSKRTPVPTAGSDASVLCKICAELMGVEQVRADANFFDLGGDSFMSIRFVALARQAGIQLEPQDVMASNSISELADRSRERSDARHSQASLRDNRNEEVIEIRSGDGQGSVLFAHEIGGECHYSQYLAEHLSSHLNLFVTKQHLPADPEAHPNSLEALASSYVDQWLDRDPDGPHYLVSYCWGGLLGYEIGRQFRLRGRELNLLAAIEYGTELAYRFAPKRNLLMDWSKGMAHRIRNRLAGVGRGETLIGLFNSIKRKVLGKFNAKPLEPSEFNFSKDMGDPRLIERNFVHCFDYRIEPSNQKVHLFRSPQRTLIGTRFIDLTYAWKYLVGKNVSVTYINGGHGGCVRPPYAKELAEAINLAITQSSKDALRARIPN